MLLFMAAMSFIACSSDDDTSVRVASVMVTGSKNQLEIGESLQLSATVSPSDATNKSVSWSTSDASIATVSSSGLVKAVSTGSATITATAQDGSGVKGVFAITIEKAVHVTSVTISGSKKQLVVGESLQLSATVSPLDATEKSVSWSTNDASVATVSSSGLVEAVNAGSVTITATAQDGSGIKDTYDITIEDIKIMAITVTGDTKQINAGEFLKLYTLILPSDATNKSVTWSTSKSSVATVSSSGLVKAIKGGSATITASAEDGSCVKGTYEVTVKEYEYVDLGLSVKWAAYNVGANSPEGYGDYFAWGEKTTKTTYNWSTYKWCNGIYNTMTKYCTLSIDGTVDKKTTLDIADDAAHANWGGSWRMPTKAEQEELRTKCTWTRTYQGGVYGYKVTSKKNANSIFLPAAGYRSDGVLSYAGYYGYYWSSSLYESDSNGAYDLYFNSGNVNRGPYYRFNGLSVRGVCP